MTDVLQEWKKQTQCHREVCSNKPVTHVHTHYPYYGYCKGCAIKINRGNPDPPNLVVPKEEFKP